MVFFLGVRRRRTAHSPIPPPYQAGAAMKRMSASKKKFDSNVPKRGTSATQPKDVRSNPFLVLSPWCCPAASLLAARAPARQQLQPRPQHKSLLHQLLQLLPPLPQLCQ